MIRAETSFDDLRAFRRGLQGQLTSVGSDLAERGESNVRSLLERQIYSQPESLSYVRSRKLIGSAKGRSGEAPRGIDVTLEAVGGNKGRTYGLYVERGTRGSRIDEDRILNDARASDTMRELHYGGTSGMRARPSVLPAIAEVERQAEDRLFEAQEKAWG